MRELLCVALRAYLWAIFLRIILSWFPLRHGGAMQIVRDVLWKVTEPVLGVARKYLPPLGHFDLSPIVVILGLQLVGAFVLKCGVV